MKPTSARVLDPRGSFLQAWNKVFVISCLVSVSVDSLFLYAPAIDGDIGCLYLDDKLEKIACLLRSLTDALYLLRMAFQFSTAFAAPTPPGAFGRGVLVDDLLAIAKHYLSTYFLVDVLAILPLPQVVRYPVLFFTPQILVYRSIRVSYRQSVTHCIYIYMSGFRVGSAATPPEFRGYEREKRADVHDPTSVRASAGPDNTTLPRNHEISRHSSGHCMAGGSL